MKKTINVNGTNFTVDVNISAEDRYDSIDSDYKKLLYLLGQVSTIGAKLDFEFTTRNFNLDQEEKNKQLGYYTETRPQVKAGITDKLVLSKHQKTTVIDTINSAMIWYKDLKYAIEQL